MNRRNPVDERERIGHRIDDADEWIAECIVDTG